MRNKVLSGVAFVAIAAGTMTFQNCGTYQPTGSSDFLSINECVGSACLISPDSIQLSVQNPDVITLRKAAPAETAVDIGGFCDSGGYAATEINWALVDSANATVASGVGGSCNDLGRFQFKVAYVGSDPAGLTLHVALYGKEGSQKIINPRGLHYQTRRLVQQ